MATAAATGGILPAGGRAPAFTLPLLGGGEAVSPDGGARGLSLVVFYKSSCPTCRLTMPFVQRLHERVAPSGGRVLAVSQDGMEGAASFARELSLSLPIAVDGAGWPVSRDFDLIAVPTLYLLDREGTIVRGAAGFSKEGLQRMADELSASVGAPGRALFGEDETVPAMKPG